MTKEEIIKAVKDFPGKKVRVAITDIDGILRGKIMHVDKFLSALETEFGFCDVVFGWDSSDVCYDNTTYTGWHTGYPDARSKIDLDTYREIPWEEDLPFFLADFYDSADGPLAVCPRSLLKTVRDRALKAGYAPVFSQEFEWFNFKEDPKSMEAKKFTSPEPLTAGMFGYSVLRISQQSDFFNDIYDGMLQFDVPLEGLHTETGPGVYEAAITYGDVLKSADRAVLFKTGVKEIAYRHELMASFMAKISPDLPGCSGHIHQSLWDPGKKNNLFYDAKSDKNMSDIFRSYLAGQIHCLPQILPMFAPTVNSFKRLVEGAWAPTTLTWAVDNRTVAFRALPTSAKAARLETRVCGSDVNPYLAMAAALASGLYGIEKGLKLDQPATVGNGYTDTTHGTLPRNLAEATEKMKQSGIARELFGDAFVDHFTASREWEWREYSKAVTDWEYKRYFEII